MKMILILLTDLDVAAIKMFKIGSDFTEVILAEQEKKLTRAKLLFTSECTLHKLLQRLPLLLHSSLDEDGWH